MLPTSVMRTCHHSVLGYLLLGMRCSRMGRVYVLTLLTLTTVTWTCLVATLLTLGVLTPRDVIARCKNAVNASVPFTSCVTSAAQPHLELRRTSPSAPRVTRAERPLAAGEVKLILRWTAFYGRPWAVPGGRAVFEQLQCAERRCALTDDRALLLHSHAVLMHMRDVTGVHDLPAARRPAQRWVFYLLESPYHSQLNLTAFNGVFNWTSTYSLGSDIPSPYGAYVQTRPGRPPPAANRSLFVAGRVFESKTRLAAWFVTNCKSQNQREELVTSLQDHVMVDVYGVCGRLKCKDRALCLDMLRRKYKFYLAFENSNCRQYITEKFWRNALENDIVPVVMGAPKEDYERVAPPHSFIHVDDFPSTRELARYLRMLHKDTRLYNEYFRWKKNGYVRTEINMHPLNSRFWCNLCSALHNTSLPHKIHMNLDEWWGTEQQCS